MQNEPRIALSFSFTDRHLKSDDGMETFTISPFDHMRMLISAIDSANPRGEFDVIVSALGFDLWKMISDAERMLAWQVYKRARVVINRQQSESHEHGAIWCIRMAIEAAAAINADYLIHTAENILLHSGTVERLISELAEVDVVGLHPAHEGCGLNTQVFGCRVHAFADLTTRRFVLGPAGVAESCERYMNEKVRTFGQKWKVLDDFAEGCNPRYFHTYDVNDFRAECDRRGITWPSAERSISELLMRPDTDKMSSHSYGSMYDSLFSSERESSLPILEIGVHHGGSLRAWAEAFPNATIHGIDIKPEAMIANHPRIRTHLVDVRDTAKMVKIGQEFGPFRAVIDDGSHLLDDVMRGFFALSPFVATGGLYIIEDIQNETALGCLMAIPGAKCFDLRCVKGRSDDIAVVAGM